MYQQESVAAPCLCMYNYKGNCPCKEILNLLYSVMVVFWMSFFSLSQRTFQRNGHLRWNTFAPMSLSSLWATRRTLGMTTTHAGSWPRWNRCVSLCLFASQARNNLKTNQYLVYTHRLILTHSLYIKPLGACKVWGGQRHGQSHWCLWLLGVLRQDQGRCTGGVWDGHQSSAAGPQA